MKAALHTHYGPPEVLRIQELETPVPKDNEVLIRVKASTVNRTDCALLTATPFIMRFFSGMRKPSKSIPGTDFAGKIEAVGKNVSTFSVGERVFGFDDLGLCSKAQYMVFPADKAIAVIPDQFSYEEAAASLEGVHYAYNFIHKIPLKPGQKVLVNGASGGIGSAAVQLLKYFGAEVTAVCATQHTARVKALGASEVIDYTKEDFTKSREKYHFILDAVGKNSFAKCKPLLEPGGIYLSSELGPWVQNPLLAIVTPLLSSKKVVFPIPSDCRRSVLLIQKIIKEGKFQAVIDREYPLEEIAEAYRYVLKGEKTGNVVIKIY